MKNIIDALKKSTSTCSCARISHAKLLLNAGTVYVDFQVSDYATDQELAILSRLQGLLSDSRRLANWPADSEVSLGMFFQTPTKKLHVQATMT
jgi:hypothetical protein